MNNLIYRDIDIAIKCSYRDISRYRRLRMKVISRQYCVHVCIVGILGVHTNEHRIDKGDRLSDARCVTIPFTYILIHVISSVI